MSYSKKGWDIISDLVRYSSTEFYDAEDDVFHNDLADIIDYMFNGKTFKCALKAYKQEEDKSTELIERMLEKLEIEI